MNTTTTNINTTTTTTITAAAMAYDGLMYPYKALPDRMSIMSPWSTCITNLFKE